MPVGIINFEDVAFSYSRPEKPASSAILPALDKINLSIREGEFLAIMGENGAGKTTLCKLINGIIPHLTDGLFSGTVTIDGINTVDSTVPELALTAGIVLDDPDAQLFTATVKNEAAFGPENIMLPLHEIEQRVRQALSVTGLRGMEERPPSTLSGGEKQRLAIAASLTMGGKILVLDEPLGRLDPEGAAEVMAALNEIREKRRITIIMASHESEMMAQYADRVCILKEGKIAALDSSENIFENHELLNENGIQIFNSKDESKNVTRKFGIREIFCEPVFLTDNPVIDIKNFSYVYKSTKAVIENINLSIADNDFAAITGKNGCGKTTLLKSITGLLQPCGGDIFIHGKNTKNLSVSGISKDIGFVMQNPDTQLFSDSVYNEIAFALKNLRLPKPEIKKRVEDALNVVGLEDADSFPHALSRAERTKTIIACVLAMGAKIIIFDEVDVGNDYKGSRKIMDIACNLNAKGFTIIFVTHNMSLVQQYAQRLIVMGKKGTVYDGRKK